MKEIERVRWHQKNLDLARQIIGDLHQAIASWGKTPGYRRRERLLYFGLFGRLMECLRIAEEYGMLIGRQVKELRLLEREESGALAIIKTLEQKDREYKEEANGG